MTSERIKEIQEQTAYPKSVSVMFALKQVWNECEQEQLAIQRVSQQRELLEFFRKKINLSLEIDVCFDYITDEDIEDCLKNFNCG